MDQRNQAKICPGLLIALAAAVIRQRENGFAVFEKLLARFGDRFVRRCNDQAVCGSASTTLGVSMHRDRLMISVDCFVHLPIRVRKPAKFLSSLLERLQLTEQ